MSVNFFNDFRRKATGAGKAFFSLAFVLICFADSSAGCSLIPQRLRQFDATEYIFIGEVVGYTKPLEFKNREIILSGDDSYNLAQKQASGLIVKVKESLYLPRAPKTHFEVFVYGLSGACGTLGTQASELAQHFPVKSEILVIAEEAELFPSVLPDGNIRLEKDFGSKHVVSLNYDEKNQSLVSANPISDYGKFGGDSEKLLGNKYSALGFEIRKDLLRLKNSGTQPERNEILNKLIRLPTDYFPLDFYFLLKTHAQNIGEAEKMYIKRLKFKGKKQKEIQESLKYERFRAKRESLANAERKSK